MTVFRRQLLLLTLKVFELMVMLVSLSMALQYRQGLPPFPASPENLLVLTDRWSSTLFLVGLSLTWHILFSVSHLYHSRRLGSRWRELYEIVKASTLGTLILLLALFTLRKEIVTPDFIAMFWVLSTGLTVLSRAIMRYVLSLARKRGHNLRFVLIVGTNNRAIAFADRLNTKKHLGYRIIGFVDDQWKGLANIQKTGTSIVSDLSHFADFIRINVVDEVMICLPLKSFYDQAYQIVAACEEQGVKVHFLPSLFDLKFARSKTERFDGDPMITFATNGMGGLPLVVKRLLDIALSAISILVLLPVFIAAALMIKLNSPGPVFFVQERIGLNKRRFRLYKFRTMVQDAERQIAALEAMNEVSGPVFKIKDDPRITAVGKFLRKTSIDELPQLFNVFKGDMSMVGPRPLPVRDYEGFDQDWHRRRFSVRPGITCLWQVMGRSGIQFDQWMELDMRYIDQWSLKLDLMILLRTIPAVLRTSGAA